MKTVLISVTAAALMLGTAVVAQDFSSQIKARKGQMEIIAINLGILGNMAKGSVEYDAKAAQAAADSIAGVTMVSAGPLWPEGSAEGSRAKAEIWGEGSGFMDKYMALQTAAVALQAAAGEGQAALGPAMGGVGGTCKDCHQTYRAPKT